MHSFAYRCQDERQAIIIHFNAERFLCSPISACGKKLESLPISVLIGWDVKRKPPFHWMRWLSRSKVVPLARRLAVLIELGSVHSPISCVVDERSWLVRPHSSNESGHLDTVENCIGCRYSYLRSEIASWNVSNVGRYVSDEEEWKGAGAGSEGLLQDSSSRWRHQR